MEIFYSESGKYFVADPMKVKSFLIQTGRIFENVELNISNPIVYKIVVVTKRIAFILKNSIGFLGYVQIGLTVTLKGLISAFM